MNFFLKLFIPKTDNYTYIGIPFDESLSLKPIQSKLNSNLNVKLNLYFRFFINKSNPLPLKKYVLISFILSLAIYYAPLFDSNKSRCSKAQKIINRGLYWSYGFRSRNSYVSLSDTTRKLRIPPLSAKKKLWYRFEWYIYVEFTIDEWEELETISSSKLIT